MGRTGLAVMAAAGLALLASPCPGASADGDPASDVLLSSDVFVPTEQPDASAASHLRATVNRTQSAGYRVKVAIIPSKLDLGLEPQFFGRPQAYAEFLAGELPKFYGPKARTGVLIAMPNGFGIAGKTFSPAERAALRGVRIPPRAGSTQLTVAATSAIRRMAIAAGKSPSAGGGGGGGTLLAILLFAGLSITALLAIRIRSRRAG